VRAELPSGAVVLFPGCDRARRAQTSTAANGRCAARQRAGRPAQEITDAVVSACRAYAGGDLGDDCAIVVIKKT
jgi:hypothetical protein